jgi:hypothetical protein
MLNPPEDPVDQLSTLWISFRPCGSGLDPVDQVMTLWTNKTGLQGGLGGKRNCCV